MPRQLARRLRFPSRGADGCYCGLARVAVRRRSRGAARPWTRHSAKLASGRTCLPVAIDPDHALLVALSCFSRAPGRRPARQASGHHTQPPGAGRHRSQRPQPGVGGRDHSRLSRPRGSVPTRTVAGADQRRVTDPRAFARAGPAGAGADPCAPAAGSAAHAHTLSVRQLRTRRITCRG